MLHHIQLNNSFSITLLKSKGPKQRQTPCSAVCGNNSMSSLSLSLHDFAKIHHKFIDFGVFMCNLLRYIVMNIITLTAVFVQ